MIISTCVWSTSIHRLKIELNKMVHCLFLKRAPIKHEKFRLYIF